MRALVLVGLLAAASPAAAQLMPGQAYDPAREAELANQQMMARQRDVALQNQLTALENQLQTERNVQRVEALRQRPVLPGALPATAASPPGYASIPDDRLANSQAKVRAAAGDNR